MAIKKHGKTRHYPALLALLASCGLGVFACARPEIKEEPQPLSAEIVKAWRDASLDVGSMRAWHDAGFEVGWMKDVPYALTKQTDQRIRKVS